MNGENPHKTTSGRDAGSSRVLQRALVVLLAIVFLASGVWWGIDMQSALLPSYGVVCAIELVAVGFVVRLVW